MEVFSYETNRDDTWIYGRTYVDGEFTSEWMQLIEKINWPRWMWDTKYREERKQAYLKDEKAGMPLEELLEKYMD